MKVEWKRGFWKGWRIEFAPKNFFDLKDWLFWICGWPIMLEGVEVAAMYLTPIYPHPLLRDMIWNWLNPWATGCPQLGPSTTDFSHDYCYGTNIAHFGGPYSILWYWAMYALSLGGRYYPYVNDLTVFVLINLFLVWKVRVAFPGYSKMSLVNAFYSWTAFMFLLAWPQVLLMLFTMTGSLVIKHRWTRLGLLILAPLLRFPVGGPGYLWTFILHYSASVPGNYPPYIATITFYLLCLGFLVRDWKNTVPHHNAKPGKNEKPSKDLSPVLGKISNVGYGIEAVGSTVTCESQDLVEHH